MLTYRSKNSYNIAIIIVILQVMVFHHLSRNPTDNARSEEHSSSSAWSQRTLETLLGLLRSHADAHLPMKQLACRTAITHRHTSR